MIFRLTKMCQVFIKGVRFHFTKYRDDRVLTDGQPTVDSKIYFMRLGIHTNNLHVFVVVLVQCHLSIGSRSRFLLWLYLDIHVTSHHRSNVTHVAVPCTAPSRQLSVVVTLVATFRLSASSSWLIVVDSCTLVVESVG